MSIIRKAIAAIGEGMEFVLSDETRDRYGDVIVAAGWDLRWFKKNPVALFGHSSGFPIGRWEDVRVEGTKLVGRLRFAEEGTSPRIDELRRLVEQGILRAVSVGFRPIEDEAIDPKNPWDGRRYLKSELLETSLVSVPANPAALAIAKGMQISDDTLAIAFGEDALGGDGIRRRGSSGEHAKSTPVRKGRTTMKTISQRVEDAQEALNQARDALTEHVAEDDYDVDAEVALSEAVKAAEDKLASLKRAESALAAKTADPARHPAPAVRKPLGQQEKEPRPADLIIRSAVCHLVAKVQGKGLDQVLHERYPDHEATHIVTKADMTIGTTTTSGWASQLVETATADFMELLSPMSVYPRLAARSGRLAFGPNSGAIKVPFESSSPSVSGSFVLEGAPIPVRRIGVDSTTLTPHKMGVISTFSRELAKYSNPQIESLLRRRILRDTAITIDTLLFDTTAGSATRPAGLLNGVSAITASSEGGYQAILDDIAALAAPFDAANAGRDLVLVMNPAQARKLRMQPGPDGTFGWAGTIMDEFAVMSSTSITSGTVIMLDAADFLTAAGDTPEFDVSESAVLHMEDTTPLEIVSGTGPTTADPVRSMFQTATMALRMLLDITWSMPRSGMIQYTTSVTWGDVI